MSNDPNVDSIYDGTDPHIIFNDAGTMQTTDTVAAMDDDPDGMPGPGLDIGAKIHLQLCSLNEKMKQNQDDATAKEQQRLAALPRRIDLHAGSNAGHTYQVLNFGSPQAGRQWHIRNAIVVTPTEGNTQIGNAVVCVGPPATPGMVDGTNGFTSAAAASAVRGGLTLIPGLGVATATYSVGEVIVKANEVAFIVVNPNLPASNGAVGTLIVEDEPVAARGTKPMARE